MATSPRLARMMKSSNARMTPVARRVAPWALIHHVGRKSGRQYTTPVVAFAAFEPLDAAVIQRPGAPIAVKTARDVLVVSPLPWGSDVDWCRNILATGSYTLTRKGRDYRVDQVRVVGPEGAVGIIGQPARFGSRVLGVKEFVVGRLGPAIAPPGM